MMALFAKINPGVIWLVIAIATDVLSTFGGVSKSMLKKSRLNFDKIEKCK